MSRRAANVIQADIARALRAASQVGRDWEVLLQGSTIRLTRGAGPKTISPKQEALGANDEEPASEQQEPMWNL